METGLLWYDGDRKRALSEKIERAAECYRKKRGVWPNTCFVNPGTIAEKSIDPTGIKIVIAHDVLLDHFWIGVACRARKRKPARSGLPEQSKTGLAG